MSRAVMHPCLIANTLLYTMISSRPSCSDGLAVTHVLINAPAPSASVLALYPYTWSGGGRFRHDVLQIPILSLIIVDLRSSDMVVVLETTGGFRGVCKWGPQDP